MKQEIKCSNCINCELYENQTSSNKYFCSKTEKLIDDIEQYYCDNYKLI